MGCSFYADFMRILTWNQHQKPCGKGPYNQFQKCAALVSVLLELKKEKEFANQQHCKIKGYGHLWNGRIIFMYIYDYF